MNPLTSVKPEDKNKVIALGAAVVLVFGYVGVSFARGRAIASAPPTSQAATPVPAAASRPASGAPPPGTVQVQEAPPTGAPAGKQASALATEAEAKAGAARQRIVLPDLSADPFTPVATLPKKAQINEVPTRPMVDMSALRRSTAGGERPQPGFALPLPPSRNGSAPFAGFTLPIAPLTGAASGATGANGMVLPAFVPEIPLALAGVIRGERNAGGAEVGAVAMIKAGEGQQFVRLGDTIEGWQVLKIQAEAVTLRRGKQTRVLRVGAGQSSPPLPYNPPAMPAPVPLSVTLPTASPAPAAIPTASGLPAVLQGLLANPLKQNTP